MYGSFYNGHALQRAQFGSHDVYVLRNACFALHCRLMCLCACACVAVWLSMPTLHYSEVVTSLGEAQKLYERWKKLIVNLAKSGDKDELNWVTSLSADFCLSPTVVVVFIGIYAACFLFDCLGKYPLLPPPVLAERTMLHLVVLDSTHLQLDCGAWPACTSKRLQRSWQITSKVSDGILKTSTSPLRLLKRTRAASTYAFAGVSDAVLPPRVDQRRCKLATPTSAGKLAAIVCVLALNPLTLSFVHLCLLHQQINAAEISLRKDFVAQTRKTIDNIKDDISSKDARAKVASSARSVSVCPANRCTPIRLYGG